LFACVFFPWFVPRFSNRNILILVLTLNLKLIQYDVLVSKSSSSTYIHMRFKFPDMSIYCPGILIVVVPAADTII